jgi:hypothetical protein
VGRGCGAQPAVVFCAPSAYCSMDCSLSSSGSREPSSQKERGRERTLLSLPRGVHVFPTHLTSVGAVTAQAHRIEGEREMGGEWRWGGIIGTIVGQGRGAGLVGVLITGGVLDRSSCWDVLTVINVNHKPSI